MVQFNVFKIVFVVFYFDIYLLTQKKEDMAMRFEDLECWQMAVKLDAKVYKFLESSLINRIFSLNDQMSASSGSIADNIAEGFERGGNKELIQFLYISKGSAGELRSQFNRCFLRELISDQEFNEFNNECIEVSKKISNFIVYLKGSGFKGDKYT